MVSYTGGICWSTDRLAKYFTMSYHLSGACEDLSHHADLFVEGAASIFPTIPVDFDVGRLLQDSASGHWISYHAPYGIDLRFPAHISSNVVTCNTSRDVYICFLWNIRDNAEIGAQN